MTLADVTGQASIIIKKKDDTTFMTARRMNLIWPWHRSLVQGHRGGLPGQGGDRRADLRLEHRADSECCHPSLPNAAHWGLRVQLLPPTPSHLRDSYYKANSLLWTWVRAVGMFFLCVCGLPSARTAAAGWLRLSVDFSSAIITTTPGTPDLRPACALSKNWRAYVIAWPKHKSRKYQCTHLHVKMPSECQISPCS